MPDFHDYHTDPGSAVNVTVQEFLLNGQIVIGGQIIADYTDTNALHFPAVLNMLTEDQRRILVDSISQQIMEILSGTEDQ